MLVELPIIDRSGMYHSACHLCPAKSPPYCDQRVFEKRNKIKGKHRQRPGNCPLKGVRSSDDQRSKTTSIATRLLDDIGYSEFKKGYGAD